MRAVVSEVRKQLLHRKESVRFLPVALTPVIAFARLVVVTHRRSTRLPAEESVLETVRPICCRVWRPPDRHLAEEIILMGLVAEELARLREPGTHKTRLWHGKPYNLSVVSSASGLLAVSVGPSPQQRDVHLQFQLFPYPNPIGGQHRRIPPELSRSAGRRYRLSRRPSASAPPS
jgi:hypothetical protein